MIRSRTTASQRVRRDVHSPIISTACAPSNTSDDRGVEGNTFHAYSTAPSTTTPNKPKTARTPTDLAADPGTAAQHSSGNVCAYQL